MLNEVQKNKFTEKVKEVAQSLLRELNIEKFADKAVCDFQSALDSEVASLVSAQEEGENIDKNLLEAYDLLVDIVLDNEDNTDFLNQLLF